MSVIRVVIRVTVIRVTTSVAVFGLTCQKNILNNDTKMTQIYCQTLPFEPR